MEDRPNTPKSEGYYRRKNNIDPLLHKKFFSKYRTIKKLGEAVLEKYIKLNIIMNFLQLNLKIKKKAIIY